MSPPLSLRVRGLSNERSKIFFIFRTYILQKSCFKLLSMKVWGFEICIHPYPILRGGGTEILKCRKIIKFITCLYSLLNTINKFVCNDKAKIAIVIFIGPHPKYHFCSFKEDNPSLELISNIISNMELPIPIETNTEIRRAFMRWNFCPGPYFLN